MRIRRIYLQDPVNYLSILEDYTKWKVQEENPELHQRLEERFHEIVERIFLNLYRQSLEEVMSVARDIIITTQHHYIPIDDSIGEISLFTFIYPGELPYLPDLGKHVKSKEVEELTRMAFPLIERRKQVYRSLVERDPVCTYGEFREVYPEVFEWMIINNLKDFDQVRVMTYEDDLKKLREWIPEIMI